MIALISLAWGVISSGWGRRIATARDAVTRFGNGASVMAIVAGIAVVSVIIGIGLAASHLQATAAASRDAIWQAQLARERTLAMTRQMARDRASERAAAAARAHLSAEAEAEAVRAADIERELRALEDKLAAKGQSRDPVVFPRAIARSLNR